MPQTHQIKAKPFDHYSYNTTTLTIYCHIQYHFGCVKEKVEISDEEVIIIKETIYYQKQDYTDTEQNQQTMKNQLD